MWRPFFFFLLNRHFCQFVCECDDDDDDGDYITDEKQYK